MMDEDVKTTLIIVGSIFIAAVAFCYIASPYQNCMRDTALADAAWCALNTDW